MTRSPVSAEVIPRAGLGAVAELLTRQSIRIAYIGHSITAQKDGYRTILHQQLSSLFRQNHVPINAALGANGSFGTLATLDELVMRHEPDLFLLECSVGDIGTRTPATTVGPAVEGIVRRLIKCGCRGCMIHLFRADTDMRIGHPVIDTHERVAEHYGIPSIHIARPLQEAGCKGSICLEQMIPDGVHTSAAGTALIAQMLCEAVDSLRLGSASAGRNLPEPLHQDHLQFASLIRPATSMVTAPERSRMRSYRLVYPYLEIDADNALIWHTGQTEISGLLLITGPHSGDLELVVGSNRTIYPTYDRWCDRDLMRTLIFDESVPTHTDMRIATLSQRTLKAPLQLPETPCSFKLMGLVATPRTTSAGSRKAETNG